MNFKLLAKLLGILAALIGSFMLFSLIWADPDVGFHTHASVGGSRLETEGIWGLVYGAIISWAIGGFLYWHGRGADTKIYRKEAMAVVGLSWALATILGALPYIFSGTSRGPAIRVIEESHDLLVVAPRLEFWKSWEKSAKVSEQEFAVLKVVTNASARGVSEMQLRTATGIPEAPEIFAKLREKQPWQNLLIAPRKTPRHLPIEPRITGSNGCRWESSTRCLRLNPDSARPARPYSAIWKTQLWFHTAFCSGDRVRTSWVVWGLSCCSWCCWGKAPGARR